MENLKNVDLNDIIFDHKNKDYGAYVLRKVYKKNLTKSTWIAIVFFTIAVSSPLIIAYVTPKEVVHKNVKKTVTLAELQNVAKEAPKDVPPPPQVEAPPLKTTVKFTVPVIKPDALVTDEFIPTIDELEKADPGKKSVEGNINANVDLYAEEVEVTEEKVVVEEKQAEAEVFSFVEEQASFPGGESALLSFFKDNVNYPEIAKRAGVEGKVIVQFVVEKDGRVTNARVVRGIGGGCDEEAVRVVRQLPNWVPGRQNGVPVRVYVSVPINFQLQ